MFTEATKGHSVNLVQALVKLDRLRRLYFFYDRNRSKVSLSGDSVTLPTGSLRCKTSTPT